MNYLASRQQDIKIFGQVDHLIFLHNLGNFTFKQFTHMCQKKKSDMTAIKGLIGDQKFFALLRSITKNLTCFCNKVFDGDDHICTQTKSFHWCNTKCYLMRNLLCWIHSILAQYQKLFGRWHVSKTNVFQITSRMCFVPGL